MRSIELRGKYAVGEYRFALVDDDNFAWLNSWKWKAKPNGGGNNIYAIRTTKIGNVNVDIRMHREVMGLERSDPRDIDHIDHDALNNQRINLRIATRSQNILNARKHTILFTCELCGYEVKETLSVAVKSKKFCSVRCGKLFQAPPHTPVFFTSCFQCNTPFIARYSTREYCSDSCRQKAKYRRVNPGIRASRKQRVLESLSRDLSIKDIQKTTAIYLSDVRWLVAELVNDGLVVRSRGTDSGGRRGYIYSKST